MLELQIDYTGNWHVGAVVNGEYTKTFFNEHVVLNIDPTIDNTIWLYFTGKNYTIDNNSKCSVTAVYFNNLFLENLYANFTFYSDNADYKKIIGSKLINMNGCLVIHIGHSAIKQYIGDIFNG